MQATGAGGYSKGMDDVSAAPVLRLPPGQKVASRVRSRHSQLMLGVVQQDGASVLWMAMIDTAGVASFYPQPSVKAGSPVPIRGDEFPCPPEYEDRLA